MRNQYISLACNDIVELLLHGVNSIDSGLPLSVMLHDALVCPGDVLLHFSLLDGVGPCNVSHILLGTRSLGFFVAVAATTHLVGTLGHRCLVEGGAGSEMSGTANAPIVVYRNVP